jgi:SAM-dependent methyltransferase
VAGLWERLLDPFRDPDPDGRAFDERYGTETHWYDLLNYEPTPPPVLHGALDAVPVPLQDLTFVDLGSGKGRVVLLASQRPFRAVVGVEHRAALHVVALRNAAAFGHHARAPVHLLHGDAAEQPFPDGPLLLWMFNPFAADVVASALGHLPRTSGHWLVYVVPRELPVVKAAGFVTVTAGGPDDCRWELLHRPAGQGTQQSA